MINWRSIEEVGLPTDGNVGYLVSDGKHIEYSDIEVSYKWKYENGKRVRIDESRQVKWLGGSVYALYEEVSGTEFDFYPTHWCPTNELNLPKK